MRIILLFAILLSQTPSIHAQSNHKEAISFIYHRFDDDRYPSTSTSSENFESHLKYLTENGFQLMTFSNAVDYLGSEQNRSKVAVITIDDGFKSFYQFAFPLLKKYNAKATLFVTTGTIGSSDFMSFDEIKEVMQYGIEIGNHSHTHPYFLNNDLSAKSALVKDEIRKSQKIFSEQLNFTPTAFAYPYGEVDATLTELVKNAGFKAAAAQNSGVMDSRSDPFRYPRFPMSDAYASLDDFKVKANAGALIPTLQSPDEYLLSPESLSPELKLEFEPADLNWDNAQCFIQGSECDFGLQTNKQKVSVVIRPKRPLTQRRTLYTITVPGASGKWHWFSHLWINPEVK